MKPGLPPFCLSEAPRPSPHVQFRSGRFTRGRALEPPCAPRRVGGLNSEKISAEIFSSFQIKRKSKTTPASRNYRRTTAQPSRNHHRNIFRHKFTFNEKSSKNTFDFRLILMYDIMEVESAFSTSQYKIKDGANFGKQRT